MKVLEYPSLPELSPPRSRGEKQQWGRLIEAARKVLLSAIKHNGTTFKDFKTSNGKHGGFQEFLAVYGRNGKPCRCCGVVLQKSIIVQRQTVFCPICQSKGE